MSSEPEIKLALFRGICEELVTTRDSKATLLQTPCGGKGGCSGSGGPQTQSQLKHQDVQPSASSLLCLSLFIAPPSPSSLHRLSVCTNNVAQRGTSLQKQHKSEERRFLRGLILGSWREKKLAEVPLSLSPSLRLSDSAVSWWKCPAGSGH